MTAYTNEIVHQRKRQLCIWGKTFHITPRTPEACRADVSPRHGEQVWLCDQPICTVLAKKHYLPLVAKDGTAPTTLIASPCGSANVM